MTSDAPATSPDAVEWNRLWQADQTKRASHKDRAHWDERALTFDKPDTPDSYVEEFLRYADIQEGETVFDMGCGTGGLALPLGAEGHRVLAADFSTGMLERLRKKLLQAGIDTVSTLELSWADDWEAKGVLPASWDICFASRSLITDDLMASLEKLSLVARRRACVTVGADCLPRVDGRILPVIGLDAPPNNDELFTVKMIEMLGYQPEVSYIRSERVMAFESEQEALKRYMNMAMIAFGSESASLTDAERMRIQSRLRSWLDDNLIETADGAQATSVMLREPRITTWAFISWDIHP